MGPAKRDKAHGDGQSEIAATLAAPAPVPSGLDRVAHLFASVRYREALEVLDATGRGEDERGRRAGWRRRLLANLGNFDEALNAATEAVACDPDSVEDHFRLAELLARCGRYAEAFAAARAIHSRAPEDIRCLALCMETALAEPSLRPAFLDWCAHAKRGAPGSGAVKRGATLDTGGLPRILLPAGRAAFTASEGSHPDALNTIRSATGLAFSVAAPSSDGPLAALGAGFDHCARLCDALSTIHPLIDRPSAARYVGQRALSLLDDGDGASLDLLTIQPMTVGQRPYILLFDLIPGLFQPFEPYARHRVSAACSPLYWIVRAFLESRHCVAIYSPYQDARTLLGQFFKSPAVERKTFMVEHLAPTATHRKAALPAQTDRAHRDGPPTLLFTASAVNAHTKFYLRGGVYVLSLFRELVSRFPQLRLVMRSPLPDTLGTALSGFARTHPNIELLDSHLDDACYLGLFRKAHIFLSPATAFYMNSALNAMRYGAVPVVSDAFGSRDMIRHDHNGILVPMPQGAVSIDVEKSVFSQDLRSFMRPDGPDDESFFSRLCDATAGLLENPERLARLARQGMDDVARGFPGHPTGTPMADILAHGLHEAKTLIGDRATIAFPPVALEEFCDSEKIDR